MIFTTKTDVLNEIRTALGEHADTHDLDAIADEAYTFDRDRQGFTQTVDTDEFWTIVERHAIDGPVTAQVAEINTPSIIDGEEVFFDTITITRGEAEIATITVESSEDPEPYDAAIREAGITEWTWVESGL